MPVTLKYAVPRAKIDLAITNWFKNKTSPQSIHISEPTYTQDMTDRIDAVLFIGGFDTAKMFSELEEKVSSLKASAVDRGLMTQDWQLPFKVEEEPPKPEEPQVIESPKPQEQPIVEPSAPEPIPPPPQIELPVPTIEEPQAIQEAPAVAPPEATLVSMEKPLEIAVTPEPNPVAAVEIVADKKEKPKRKLRTKKAEPTQPTEKTKPKRTRKSKPIAEQK
jgi:hypothetical protein